MMQLYVAATGSAANTYVLTASSGESLILDAGAPIKKVLPHIPDLRKVRRLLVTHEHKDHSKCWFDYWMRGIDMIASKGTIEQMMPAGIPSMVQPAVAMRPVSCGEFTVMPFDVQHDAAEPFGFLIKHNPTGETLVYATDTYYLKYTFPYVNYWLVECNYCEDLIKPDEMNEYHIKRLNESHMNLRRLMDALKANDLTETAKIVLVHLSDSRSNEQRMVSEISDLTGIETVAASAGMTIELSRTPF